MRPEPLRAFSPKFARCIESVLTKPGKSFIYFNQVKLYGVDFLCQALKENGLLEYKQPVQKTSICFRCRQSASHHDMQSRADHAFQPFYFFRITGEEGSRYEKALGVFNSPNNNQGQHLQVVVGSQRVLQGFNFLAVNNVYILSFPFNMPNMI